MGTPLVVGARAFVPLADRVLALRVGDGRELWSGATPFAKPPAGVAALRGDVLAGGAVEPWRFGQATGAQRYAGNGSVNQSTPAQLGTDGRYVYGRYVDGNRAGVWRASNGAPVTSLPASWQPAVRGGWMYFANGGPGSFDAWSWRNGRPVLRWSVGRSIGWDPALLAGRVVYAKTSMDHCLHALDARTGASLWRSDPLTARGSLPPGAPLTADRRLYLGLDSAVVALRSARGAPSGSCPRTAPARR
jgi:outer membrane protein assembly factor BamB